MPQYWRAAPTACALADHSDPWEAPAAFIRGIVEADVHSLTVHLAGTFTPTTELHQLATHADSLSGQIFHRAKTARVVRDDLDANDLPMIFEQMTAIRVGDPERAAALRRRYLPLLLDALHTGTATAPLPEPAPASEELGQRWTPTEP